MYQTSDNVRFKTMTAALEHERQLALELYFNDEAVTTLLNHWYAIQDIMTKSEPLLTRIQHVHSRRNF